ncbi:hypothetical protein VNO77_27435 [Canavalia gladiata]|uniref:AP2/ERF domain-containing protein n=1 Tax=Canavalia gladiata TaxID=3824 RepID=A0AAN9KYU8_CANGL
MFHRKTHSNSCTKPRSSCSELTQTHVHQTKVILHLRLKQAHSTSQGTDTTHERRKKLQMWPGTFPMLEMAARAHDMVALGVKGNSTILNFPKPTNSPTPHLTRHYSKTISETPKFKILLHLKDSPIIEKRSFTVLLALESSVSASVFAHSAACLLSLHRPISLLALCSSFAFEECF